MITQTFDAVEWGVKKFRTDERNDQYADYQRYLDGDHPLQFATPKYESAFGNLLKALWYDRTNMVIDAHADRLQINGFNAKKDGVSKAAMQLWGGNHMERREGEIETEAFGMGDGYVIVEKHPVTGKVHIWPNDARNMRVLYSSEEPGRIELAVKIWKREDSYVRLNVYYPGRIEKFISKTKSHGDFVSSSKIFQQYEAPGEPWPVMLDVPDVVPVFHVANNARTGKYGTSELRHVLPMQDAVNKTLTDLMVAMEFGAFPQKVILGVEEMPPAETPEGQDARTKRKAFELGIDRIMAITSDTAKIAEFQAVALAQFIATADFFDQAVSRVTRVPVHYLGMSGDFPSGAALRMAEAPFVAKIVDRQRAFGEVYGNFVEYALRLQGIADPGEITPVWQSASPLSIDDELNMAGKKVAIGIPLEYILRGMSEYSEDDVTKIIDLAKVRAEQARRAFNAGLFAPDLLENGEAA